MSGSVVQSIMNSERSTRPTSRRAAASPLNLLTVLPQPRPELAAADHLVAGDFEGLQDSRLVLLGNARLGCLARRMGRRVRGARPQALRAAMLDLLDGFVQMAPLRLAPSLVVVAFLVGSVRATVVAVAHFGHHLLEDRSGLVGDHLLQRLVRNRRNLEVGAWGAMEPKVR